MSGVVQYNLDPFLILQLNNAIQSHPEGVKNLSDTDKAILKQSYAIFNQRLDGANTEIKEAVKKYRDTTEGLSPVALDPLTTSVNIKAIIDRIKNTQPATRIARKITGLLTGTDPFIQEITPLVNEAKKQFSEYTKNLSIYKQHQKARVAEVEAIVDGLTTLEEAQNLLASAKGKKSQSSFLSPPRQQNATRQQLDYGKDLMDAVKQKLPALISNKLVMVMADPNFDKRKHVMEFETLLRNFHADVSGIVGKANIKIDEAQKVCSNPSQAMKLFEDVRAAIAAIPDDESRKKYNRLLKEAYGIFCKAIFNEIVGNMAGGKKMMRPGDYEEAIEQFEQPFEENILSQIVYNSLREVTYTIKPGDTWESIAKARGVKPELLKWYNSKEGEIPGRTPPVGRVLAIPGAEDVHFVRREDVVAGNDKATWQRIANRYGMDARKIQDINGLRSRPLKEGDCVILASSTVTVEVSIEITWDDIEKIYKMPARLIKKFNGIVSNDPPAIGTLLRIPPMGYL